MANTSVIVIPEGKICDYVDGKFRNDTPEEYVRQTIEKRLVNEHKYLPKQIRIRTAQIFHLLLAVISNRQNRRKALKLLDLLRNQNHPKLSSFIRCYP